MRYYVTTDKAGVITSVRVAVDDFGDRMNGAVRVPGSETPVIGGTFIEGIYTPPVEYRADQDLLDRIAADQSDEAKAEYVRQMTLPVRGE